MAKGDVCEVEGCGSIKGVWGKSGRYQVNLCSKHRRQMDRHGNILEITKNDPNEITLNDDIAEITLRDRKYNIVGIAIIDSVKADIVRGYKWHMLTNGYVSGSVGDKEIYLHRLVTSATQNTIVDHCNHNLLDNRLDNLRICTHQENLCNQKLNTKNTSGYKGVTWDSKRRKWIAQIGVDMKCVHLGRFNDINDAITARKEAEVKYFGDFRYKEVI